MARQLHTINVGNRTIQFGHDPITLEIDIPADIDANDLVNIIAEQFKDVDPVNYPLEACLNTDTGRQLNLAPGWTISSVSKARIKNAGNGSNFM